MFEIDDLPQQVFEQGILGCHATLERRRLFEKASVIGIEGDDVRLHLMLRLKELIDLGLQGQ